MRIVVLAALFAVFFAAGNSVSPRPAFAQSPPSPLGNSGQPTSPFYDNAPVPPNLADSSTRACHNATDCVTVAASPCGAPIAINRRYVYAIQGYNQYMFPRTSCNVAKQNLLLTPICQSGVCALTNYYSPNSVALRERQLDDPLYCNAPSDCGVATDACGHKTALNNRHLAAFQQTHPATGVCTSYTETRAAVQKDCQNNTCVVYLNNSSTTQEAPAVAETPAVAESLPAEEAPAVESNP